MIRDGWNWARILSSGILSNDSAETLGATVV
jgi:hypothetical protein